MNTPHIRGRQMGSIKALRASLKKGGGGQFIKGVGEAGIVVRFLTEPEQWFGYPEHYDDTVKAFFPCIDGQCPGCEQGMSASNRYLANALDVEEDKAIPLKLAKTLANRVMVKYDRYGTLMDRDFELTRSGEGFDTEYDVEPLAPKKRLLTKYKLYDLQQVLLNAWKQAFGEEDDEEDDDDEEEETPRRGPKARPRTNPRGALAGKRVPVKKAVAKKVPVRKVAGAKAPVARKKPIAKKAAPIRRTVNRRR